jgi:hypothetical protein
MEIALDQARLFNSDCPIYLIANEQALSNFSKNAQASHPILVSCESLEKSEEHRLFIKNSKLDKISRDGFWFYTTERFFYLYDFAIKSNLEHIFHVENDNMLYSDVEKMLPFLSTNYQGIAATFDNEIRCIAGFMYIQNKKALKKMNEFLAHTASEGINEMESIAIFRQIFGKKIIDHLPIIPPEYISTYSLRTIQKRKNQNPDQYCNNFIKFNSVFDAAALGQYLGGIDPRNGPSEPGFINESCVFDPSLMDFEWVRDEEGRYVPFMKINNHMYRINNLHIHSKKLEEFYSS